MSEPVLERSVLERKERDELLTIARAMGATPTTRAKKATLVDLILTTAGITSAPAEDEAPEAEAEPAPARRGRARGAAKSDADVDTGDAETDDDTSEPAEQDRGARSSGDDRPARQARQDRGQGGGNQDRANRNQSGQDQRDQERGRGQGGGQQDRGGAGSNGNQDRGNQGGNGNQSGSRNQGNQGNQNQNQGNQNQGNQGNQNQGNQGNQNDRDQGDDGDEDGGNRRRRRRGRDRDQRGPQGQDDAFVGEPVDVDGLLDLRDEGYGFLRTRGYLASRDDVYVSVKQVRQFGLRKGDHVAGASRPANRNEKNPALLRIDKVNDQAPEAARRRPQFEDLTPLFPDERLRLEDGTQTGDMTARIVDLISPIGKGQRGLVVSPPKAGKTTVLKQIVRSIERNNPEVHLMVLLVDERPEEVTDMRRSTGGEVIASTFDRPTEEHIAVAELVIERARRLVEDGKDVVIILDGITRLARAYNLAAPATGRIMSGGVDSGALYPPKRFFGSARNIEEGGSLTILATALIETGSKMDEVIFEEFKGTGNMELRLDRHLAERRIYPAIDVDGSSTRHEELLFDRTQLQQVWRVRRALNALSSEGGSTAAALERLMDGLKTFKSNAEFLAEAAKAGS
ncbi:MAG TPA: transcription termination factor Rho [Acidimicrobiales bacterium]|nr:transcription termination factor Rho [Acidimicrobiales bacterium]